MDTSHFCHAADECAAPSLINPDCTVRTEYFIHVQCIRNSTKSYLHIFVIRYQLKNQHRTFCGFVYRLCSVVGV